MAEGMLWASFAGLYCSSAIREGGQDRNDGMLQTSQHNLPCLLPPLQVPSLRATGAKLEQVPAFAKAIWIHLCTFQRLQHRGKGGSYAWEPSTLCADP